jgi:hypothetical protein
VSLQPGFIHETTYQYTDRHRNRRNARVRVGGLDGMSAHDEVYLWGLLALAVRQPRPKADLFATPYYCLRQLGMITSDKRGGRDYQLFRDALKRLAGIRYQNDAFYDPIRGEHRRVSFGFLNYSLPLDSESSRAWRFAWDPIFFEFAQATGGALSFDLALYRSLDAATRRLYLFLKKQFWRSEVTGRLDLRHLATETLGYAPWLPTTDLKKKVGRCIDQLVQVRFLTVPTGVAEPEQVFKKLRRGVYSLRLHRGPAFDNVSVSPTTMDSPLLDPLRSIGFDAPSIDRILKRFPAPIVEQWADITLAAIERNGLQFFKKNPQAYFLDNVKTAAEGNRTPPDWWRELRKRELELQRQQERGKARLLNRDPVTQDAAFDEYLRTEARAAFERLTRQLVADLQKSGQTEPEAQQNGRYMARMHLRNQFRKEHPEHAANDGFQPLRALL